MAEGDSGIVERAKQAITGADGEPDEGEQEEKVEGRSGVIRNALRAYGEGNIDEFLGALSDDVEWVGPEGRKFPGAGTHRGRDAVKENFIQDVKRGFPEFGYRPAYYLDAEDEQWVVTLGSFVGAGKSGEFDVPAAVVWEFEEQTISRVRIHADSDAFPEPVREEDEEQEREPESKEDEDRPQAREGEPRDESSESEQKGADEEEK